MANKTSTRTGGGARLRDDRDEILAAFDLPEYVERSHPGCRMRRDGADRAKCAAVWRGGDDPEKVHFDFKDGVWLWHDHKTQQGGTAIDFLIKAEDRSLKAAMECARELAGMARVVPMAKRRDTGWWVYVDEAGADVNRVVRCEPGPNGKPKGYRQEAADGSGGWRKGEGCMKGVRRVPYRLPELLRADVVYVVEGEKCADRLHAGGLVATCNAMGAGKWTPEHAGYLAGKHVVVLGDNDDPGREHVAQVVRTLVDTAASIKVPNLEGLPEKGDVVNWLDAGRTIDDLRALVDVTPEHDPAQEAITAPPPDDDRGGDDAVNTRRAIVVQGGTLALNIREMEAALIASDAEIYRRGLDLVWLTRTTDETNNGGIKRGAGALTIVPVSEHRLMEVAAAVAHWVKPDGRKRGELVPVNPPMPLLRAYLAGASERKHPALRGIVECPIVRHDGSILDAPGYDENTGLYHAPSLPYLPNTENPTQADALAALAVLREPLEGFPFDTPADESVALAAILTAFVRRSIPSAPLFAFDAPKPRTGKSLLIEVLSRIATGRAAPMMHYSTDDRENEKRMFAALLSGDPLICIDNVDPKRPLESPELCSILTQESYTCRVLGVSRTQTVSTSAVWLASGNNISFAADMADRVLRCRLDAKQEHPEDRAFKRSEDELLSWVLSQRANLVRAALIILRAYHVAGLPGRPGPFGGFSGWSNIVRGAICWLGLEDPCNTRQAVKADDPARTSTAALLQAWHEVFGSTSMMTREVETRAANHPVLQYALQDAITKNSTLGHWCRGAKDGVYGGFTLKEAGSKKHTKIWKVIPIGVKKGGDGGDGGDPIPYARKNGFDETIDKNVIFIEQCEVSPPCPPCPPLIPSFIGEEKPF